VELETGGKRLFRMHRFFPVHSAARWDILTSPGAIPQKTTDLSTDGNEKPMLSQLLQPANTILLQAIGKLFLISLLGYGAVRLRILSGQAVASLSKFVLAISLPCLIIATLGRELQYSLLPQMGLCLVAALVLNLSGLLIALAGRGIILKKEQPGQRLFLSLSSLQNSGYLPIPLVTAVLPEGLQASGLLFIFVYMLVMGLIFWSFGILLVGRNHAPGNLRQQLKNMANPPLLVTLASLFFLFPPVKSALSALPLLQDTLTAVGETTIPLVLIVLGGSLAEKLPPLDRGKIMIAGSCAIKMLLIPALTLLAITAVRPEPVFAFVLLLESTMPAALNHIVVAREYGGDVPLTSRALLVQYLLALFTVPLFLILANLLFSLPV